MGNVMSYLKWRGDLDFKERAFGEVDNLVLSILAYVDLDGIVPEEGAISLCEAEEKYWNKHQINEKEEKNNSEELFGLMAESRRFCHALLSDYREDSGDSLQFAALQIHLDDGTKYIAFRGTDDSIAGWREDFATSYQVTKAQELAVQYLNRCITESSCVYRIGGHSKGGNLAVYAAMQCPEEKQKAIQKIYNNDGPGICPELMNEEGFERIRRRIVRYIPEFSVIGKLFETELETHVVGSSAEGILQHDAATWTVEGDVFEEKEDTSEKCAPYNQIFDTWIAKASMEQREIFTRNFFDALEAGGAKKVSEVPESGLGGYGTILLALAQSESQTKIVIGKLISSFVGYLKNVDIKQALKSRQGIYGAGCMLLGMFFIIFPQGAVNSIGIIAAAIGILWSSRRIAALVFENEEPKTRKQRKLITYEAVMCLMAVMAGNSRIAMISVNFVLGAMLIGFAFSKIWKMMTVARGNRIFQVWTITESAFALLLGVVTVVTTGQVSSSRMLTVGTFLILYGIGKIVLEMYGSAKQKLEKT